ncbi:MAG TPA: DUF6624 domain-containing protein [Pyrinomonadaceae bacterium]|nr:DUF6624 domain-containing protein [Pyrinomonadaceae bacterium]
MIRIGFLTYLIVLAACIASAQSMPDLRKELLQMRDRDQAVRETCTNGTADEQIKCLMKAKDEIDTPNTKRLNDIFIAHGFPTASLVGPDGVQAFALLMQHSGDIELKKRSEKGMQRALRDKVIAVMDYANFVDRLLTDQGKLQIYGSNFVTQGGKFVMSPVEDPKNLDKRRKKIGLPPIDEYAKKLGEIYKLEVVIPKP